MNSQTQSVDWHHRAFSQQKHAQWLDRVKQELDQAGLAGCVCVSPEL